MFENLRRSLKELEKNRFVVPVDVDANGFIEKQCPNTECEFIFKVHKEDGQRIIKEEAMWCPMCGHCAPERSWFTRDQIEQGQRQAVAVLKGKLNQAMRDDAETFNRREQRQSFVKMSMSVTGGTARTQIMPIAATEVMQLEVVCEACTLKFAVIGAAYFCPGCGLNSVERMFQDSLRKIRAKKENLDLVRTAFEDVGKKDDGELTCRSLVETCLQDGVTAFQKYAERLYDGIHPKTPAPFNAFQRLTEGSKLWKEATGVGYEDLLTKVQLEMLNLLYQKRHLLAHSEGIVDDKYIIKSGDKRYQPGQRITVSPQEVDALIECLSSLGNGLKAAITKTLSENGE